jgi:hypothetical protein
MHLPGDYTFGVKNECGNDHIYELTGNSAPKVIPKISAPLLKAAGHATNHYDDLDLQRHIVPKLGPLEDQSLARKITEDVIGGAKTKKESKLGIHHVFGVPTVRDVAEKRTKGPRRLGDKTVGYTNVELRR